MLWKEVMDEKIETGIDNMNHVSALDRIMQAVMEAEETGERLFIPDINPLQMHYRTEIIALVESRGWKLIHWSVTGIPPFVCAYPVFERFS